MRDSTRTVVQRRIEKKAGWYGHVACAGCGKDFNVSYMQRKSLNTYASARCYCSKECVAKGRPRQSINQFTGRDQ